MNLDNEFEGERQMSSCFLCNSKKSRLRHKGVRDNEGIDVLECIECGLVYLSSVNHINEAFYENSGMLNGKVDLQKYRQQSFMDDSRRAKDLKNVILGKKVLDFGCGAGGFLHLIKNKCKEIAGVELDKSLNESINKEGINCYSNISEINDSYDVITLFHVLEHLKDPMLTLQKLKKHLNKDGTIIIEVPNADDALLTLFKNEKFSKFTYWSCHLYLYNNYTLQKICENAGYNVKLIKQIQRYPLSNHLYWLNNGLPGGHVHYNMLNDDILNNQYANILAALGKCDTIVAEINISRD